MTNPATAVISAIQKIPDLELQIATLTAENERLRAALDQAVQHLGRMKPTPARTTILGVIRAALRREEVDE